MILYCRLLESWVSSWAASSFEISGNNHQTARRRNRNNCFLNKKTGLKTAISFSTVSFPVGRVGNLPLNFAPTSPISRCFLRHERCYRGFTYIQVGAVENIPRFPMSPSLYHTDTRARTHTHVQVRRIFRCHSRLANELYKYYNIIYVEQQLISSMSAAWRRVNITLKNSPLVEQSADKSLARPERKQANVSVRMAWISFGALPCRKRNLMTARVSILLKSPASLTCFRTFSFLVGLRTYQHPGYMHNLLWQ